MEELPKVPQNNVPTYESLKGQVDRDRNYRVKKTENRLAFIMAIAHGAVELSLRRESPSVRRTVRNDLNRRYGFRASQALNAGT